MLQFSKFFRMRMDRIHTQTQTHKYIYTLLSFTKHLTLASDITHIYIMYVYISKVCKLSFN